MSAAPPAGADTQLRDATVAQLGEMARIQHRYGPLRARLTTNGLLVLDVYGITPLHHAGQLLPWLTVALLPSGRARAVRRHDYTEVVTRYALDAAIVDETRRDPQRRLSVGDLSRALDAPEEDVRDSLQRLIGFGLLQRDRRRYRALMPA